MGRLLDWWDRVTGSTAPTPARSGQRPPQAAVGRPPARPGELTLADSPPRPAARRAGASGLDPYASDGGHAKPHSWERLDHD